MGKFDHENMIVYLEIFLKTILKLIIKIRFIFRYKIINQSYKVKIICSNVSLRKENKKVTFYKTINIIIKILLFVL